MAGNFILTKDNVLMSPKVAARTGKLQPLVRCEWLERPENLQLHMEAREYLRDKTTTGTSRLQRQFRLGYTRASQLIDSLMEMCVLMHDGEKWQVLAERDWVTPNTPHQLQGTNKG